MFMATLGLSELTLLVIVGTLAAIVYALRILVMMERRIANMEGHVERVATKILKEELKIEKISRRK
jgi:hypothetical protein